MPTPDIDHKQSIPVRPHLLASVILIVVSLTITVPAEGTLTPEGIDWLNGRIKATGIAYPQKKDSDKPRNPSKMLSVAKVSAQQNLLTTIKKLQVSSTKQVDTIVGSDPMFMGKIQDLIKNAPIVKQAYLSDGTLEVEVELGLWGAFSQLILPPEVKPIEAITPLYLSNSKSADPPENTPWTGLIVDARGLDLQPVLVPSIFDERGKQVYGPAFINRDFAVQWGMCGYATRVDDPLAVERVGAKPLVVKAIDTVGPRHTDIVIGSADADRIRAVVEHVVILREGRMIVVTD